MPESSPAVVAANTSDVVSIRQLLHRYCHLLDEGSPAEIAALFHPQATLLAEYEGSPPHRGRPALQQWLEAYTRASRAGSFHRRHQTGRLDLQVQGTRGWGDLTLDASGIQCRDGRLWHYVGYYRDEWIKDQQRWFFWSRRVGVWYQYPTRVPWLCGPAPSDTFLATKEKGEPTLEKTESRTCGCAGGEFMSAVQASCGLEPGGVPALSPAQAAEVVAIEQLLNRYCYLHDFGSAEEIAALFAPAAVIYARYLGDQTFSGRPAIRQWYADCLKIYQANGHFERRRITCPVINVTGDRAEAVCFVDFDALRFSDHTVWKHTGRYEFKLGKEKDRWFIAALAIALFYSHPCNPHTLARNGTLELEAIGKLPKTTKP